MQLMSFQKRVKEEILSHVLPSSESTMRNFGLRFLIVKEQYAVWTCQNNEQTKPPHHTT